MQGKIAKLLAIESSCDDTSVAVLRLSESGNVEVLALAVQSQWDVHEKYGGVVPELASRAHLKNILPCLEKVLSESNTKLSEIDVFAATGRPGLVGALLIGHTAAKTLAALFNKPFISCNHLEGHLASVWIEHQPTFPYLTLLVSGGHSSLYLVKSFSEFELLGSALDDAAGEAFDKGAKLLGLGFPGGPAIEALAKNGDKNRYSFGRVKTPDLQFSFSGIKSELVRWVQKEGDRLQKADMAASYQNAILNHLEEKISDALAKTSAAQLVIVGGVAQNQNLRDRLNKLVEQQRITHFMAPSLKYCTDNAAMIGRLAFEKAKMGDFSNLDSDVGATTRQSAKKKHAS